MSEWVPLILQVLSIQIWFGVDKHKLIILNVPVPTAFLDISIPVRMGNRFSDMSICLEQPL